MRRVLGALVLLAAATGCDTTDEAPTKIVWDCSCTQVCGGVTRAFAPPRVCLDDTDDDAMAMAEADHQCLGDVAKNCPTVGGCSCTCALSDPIAVCGGSDLH